MSSIDSLLVVARAYAQAEGIDLSKVSWRALRDNKKLPALAAGADIQIRRFEKTMSWFSDNWPANAVWPAAVARPEHRGLEHDLEGSEAAPRNQIAPFPQRESECP